MWIEGPGPDFTTVVIKYHPSATPLQDLDLLNLTCMCIRNTNSICILICFCCYQIPSATQLHFKTLIFYNWECTIQTGVGNSLYIFLAFIVLNFHRFVLDSMFLPDKAYFFFLRKLSFNWDFPYQT